MPAPLHGASDLSHTVFSEASALWLRAFLEIAYSYGWRKSEILGLRVRQLNFANRTIRLDPGMTKNGEGREVTMTSKVAEMLRQAVIGKSPDSFVLTRADGKPVKEFRKAWQSLCVRAGLGSFICTACDKAAPSTKCACGSRRRKYRGLIRHDLRRSAAKALRAAGVPESVVMSTGGWKTAAMFRRYAIVSNADQRAAVEMLEKARELQESARAELSHNSAIIALKSTTQGAVASTTNKSKRVN
jgi:integrase